jgi:hypothetical protein
MKNKLGFIAISMILFSCSSMQNSETRSSRKPIEGTWKLLTGTLIEKGDTAVTDYTKDKEFIKIINENHFAFLMHDLHKGKNADSAFSCGGVHYTLNDSAYTDH